MIHCKLTEQGEEYIGRRNVTFSDQPCLPWRGFEASVTISSFPDSDDVDAQHNFCRNARVPAMMTPNAKLVAPWCYIEGENREQVEHPMQYCNVNFCERRVQVGAAGHVYPECRLSEKGTEYVGSQKVTETGKTCTQSDEETFSPEDFTYEFFVKYAFYYSIPMYSYCRNSMHYDRPWCFVSDSNASWEYCDIPFCHDPNPPEFKLSPRGVEYVGRMNVTISGYPCKPWLKACPRRGLEDVCGRLSLGLSDEVDGNHRFCRNLKPGYHGPWCFIDSEEKEAPDWEYCDVPFRSPMDGERCDIRVNGDCVRPQECKKDKKGKDYIGTKNVTKKGFPCQLWLSNYPNDQLITVLDYEENNRLPWYNMEWTGSSLTYKYASYFPDDLHPQHNFCRNPNEDEEGPWCLNAAGRGRDFCDIPQC
ncbi:unnamed protein product [Darwinula stevensoni]|uniref:Kringle domain-containing protein n=1 Tax=Darwinula stevensoni TaxID=69355 RepID=A0A7R8XB10_9CRUS|nr:unnamed protein product [Darwinula stevensoni]CAG0886120.1 unnamed protein product [Darwinula stevensoni]